MERCSGVTGVFGNFHVVEREVPRVGWTRVALGTACEGDVTVRVGGLLQVVAAIVVLEPVDALPWVQGKFFQVDALVDVAQVDVVVEFGVIGDERGRVGRFERRCCRTSRW